MLSPCELTEHRRIECHRQASSRCFDGLDLAQFVDQIHHCRVTGFDQQCDTAHRQSCLLLVGNRQVTKYVRWNCSTRGQLGLDQLRVHPDGLVVDRKGTINLGQRKCSEGLLVGLAAGLWLVCGFRGGDGGGDFFSHGLSPVGVSRTVRLTIAIVFSEKKTYTVLCDLYHEWHSCKNGGVQKIEELVKIYT